MRETLELNATRAEDIVRAAEMLRQGKLVAFPTETVYGLGASALSGEAVAGIFAAKGRPSWDPLIVHVAELAQVEAIATVSCEIAERVASLAQAFWPGPLTLLLPRTSMVPDAVTAGRAKVGVRVPAHPVAQALLRAAGIPVAAPSANRFGHISPTTAAHVLDDLRGQIDAVLDGGPTEVGVESTVLDPEPTPMVIYRTGAVTAEQIERATSVAAEVFKAEPVGTPESLPSPGVGMRHYAPEARLVLTDGTEASLRAALARVRHEDVPNPGVLLPHGWQCDDVAAAVVPWGAWDDPESLAASVFAGLRALEQMGVTAIVCPLPQPGGLRDAVRDRLLKAARPR